MRIQTYPDRGTMSRAATEHAADVLKAAIALRGRARIIAATGASQLDFLAALTEASDIPWALVEMFHLDEYISLAVDRRGAFANICWSA